MSTPDLVEPVLGFRAWNVRADGRLTPWSAGPAGTWRPGDNQARCLAGGRHAAPGRRCTCGLYALTDLRDPRLRPRHEAVGAIVAWGDVEAHRTGFRAQYARIVALAEPPDGPWDHASRLQLAAASYEVPLVPLAELEATGLLHGRPLEFELLPAHSPPQREKEPAAPGLDATGERGIAVHEHLRVDIVSPAVRVALTDQLAQRLGRDAAIDVAPPGTDLRLGDPLARIDAEGDTFVLGAPVSGCVTATVEPGGAAATHGPGTATHGPGAAWLCELAPSRWAEEAATLAWGSAGERSYQATLAHAGRAGDPFRFVRSNWMTAYAHVQSAGDVAAELRALRGRPRFGSAAELALRLGGALRAALTDTAVRRRAVRADARIAWRLHRPDADVMIDLTGNPPRVEVGELDVDGADLVLYASADTADDYFAGRADMPGSLRRREIQTSADHLDVLRVASVIKALHSGYAAARREADLARLR